jgi:hypothetical protein
MNLRSLLHAFALLAIGLTPSVAPGQEVITRDGKITRTQGLRRDGNFLFLKPVKSEGAPETLIPTVQVERIVFSEPSELAEAKSLAASGNAEAVLEKTKPLLAFARPFADLNANLWPEILRLHLAAIASSAHSESLGELQKIWVPTGDADIDGAYKLIASMAPGADRTSFEALWRSHARPGATTLCAALSWLELGESALKAGNWNEAIRAFLSIEVFAAKHSLIQPRALLGAAKGLKARGDSRESASLLSDLSTLYPNSSAFRSAADLFPRANTPSLQKQ